jgi:hypothetical protein
VYKKTDKETNEYIVMDTKSKEQENLSARIFACMWELYFLSLAALRWETNKLSLIPTSAIRPPSARRTFRLVYITITPFAVEDEVDWLLWRLRWVIALPFWWLFDVSRAWVQRNLVH